MSENTLTNNDAVQKIIELASEQICMFSTYRNGRMVSRPMATLGVDADGSLWFFSEKSSDKNDDIEDDDETFLNYMDAGKSNFMSLNGRSHIITDAAKAARLWTPLAKSWFEKGPDDPDLTMIKVVPHEGHFWEARNGKLMRLLKLGFSAITGIKTDLTKDGNLNFTTNP